MGKTITGYAAKDLNFETASKATMAPALRFIKLRGTLVPAGGLAGDRSMKVQIAFD
ncbi:hypothetical protein MPLSOD_40818 [Mesorhizobium sp. SOD10]|nr:hypothetical protein MPLSOD_40818 [Mesorhizobium sp. SOD10]